MINLMRQEGLASARTQSDKRTEVALLVQDCKPKFVVYQH